MEQTRETIAQKLAERLCWHAARRGDARVARHLYRKQVVNGVYQIDAGTSLHESIPLNKILCHNPLDQCRRGLWQADLRG